VTSIAMFYDLDDPVKFAREIHEVLADDGVWHFEQSYMPSMLRLCSYDTICHEHLEYYSLGVVGDILAGSRVLQQRILERVRRVELHLGVEPSHYEPGQQESGQQATTGAQAGPATGKTEDREALKL